MEKVQDSFLLAHPRPPCYLHLGFFSLLRDCNFQYFLSLMCFSGSFFLPWTSCWVHIFYLPPHLTCSFLGRLSKTVAPWSSFCPSVTLFVSCRSPAPFSVPNFFSRTGCKFTFEFPIPQMIRVPFLAVLPTASRSHFPSSQKSPVKPRRLFLWIDLGFFPRTASFFSLRV